MIKSWEYFILEGYKRPSRGEILEGTEDQVEEILQKWVPWYDPIDVKMPLYRAVMVGSSKKPYFAYKVMNPKNFVRKPPTTENYYNIIIDNSKDWVDFPKRSRSIMAHSKESKTRLYGNKLYRVIPLKENAKCAYVEDDYWMAFDKLYKQWPFGHIDSLNDFNDSLRNVFNLTKKDYSSEKLKMLLSSSNLNNENLSYYANQSVVKNWKDRLKKIESEYGSFYDWIDKQMAPEFTKIHTFNYNNESTIDPIKSSGYEIWTDEKCLLVDDDILRKLYIKKKNPVNEKAGWKSIILGIATFLSVGLTKVDAQTIKNDQLKLSFVKDVYDWNKHIDTIIPKKHTIRNYLLNKGWKPDTIGRFLIPMDKDGNRFFIDESFIQLDPEELEFKGDFLVHPNFRFNVSLKPKTGLSNLGVTYMIDF